MPDIVVLVAHPQLEHSRVNRALMQAARASGRAGRVEVRDLYALYPDYLIDVAAEQAALAAARLVVWQHPIHWYGMPPLMKLWLDEVLAFGWAYGPGGTALQRQGPVAGGLHRRAGGVVPARQLQPLLLRRLPAALRADRGAVRHALPAAAAAARRAPRRRGRARRRMPTTYAQRLASYPDWPEIAELEPCAPCEVPRATPARRAPRKPEHGTRHALAARRAWSTWARRCWPCRWRGCWAWARSSATWPPASPIGPWGLKLVTDAAGRSCTSPSSAWC